jgi:hypothetical protein
MAEVHIGGLIQSFQKKIWDAINMGISWIWTWVKIQRTIYCKTKVLFIFLHTHMYIYTPHTHTQTHTHIYIYNYIYIYHYVTIYNIIDTYTCCLSSSSKPGSNRWESCSAATGPMTVLPPRWPAPWEPGNSRDFGGILFDFTTTWGTWTEKMWKFWKIRS